MLIGSIHIWARVLKLQRRILEVLAVNVWLKSFMVSLNHVERENCVGLCS